MKFNASAVEVYEDEDIGVITIHFDDESETYLQFQGAVEGFEDDYYDGGFVYMEIADQLYGGYDCFGRVELTRTSLQVKAITDDRIRTKAEHVLVSFEIDDSKYQKVEESFSRAFRDCAEKLEIAEQDSSTPDGAD